MYTIQQIINALKAGIDVPLPTVDQLLMGSPDTEAKGVVTAFSASRYVIDQAIYLGANLIISHEGVFYNHQDEREWLGEDPVYLEKARLIKDSGISIFRFHDYAHRSKPDAIMTGLLRELGWENYVSVHHPAAAILNIPPMTLAETADYLKKALQISYVRVAGDLSMPCTWVGILVGYRGCGRQAIPLFQQEEVDLIIAGEGPEWETPEYVKDAVQQGRSKALIMLGHAESEAPGMKYVAELLSEQFPGLPVSFIRDQPVFYIV
ncbi:Nif3-like dinuclear metal center hexameric protein [Paenibacillus jiagnxiensis]|uniref:Nif3-like dinuclear metal center hexameric protein n=1 Tax=Paenibacillus jiagnxiensis TaxID=3228926 RepID=UPI0033A510D3